jgi:transglutaminase-like putative cysteine protease
MIKLFWATAICLLSYGLALATPADSLVTIGMLSDSYLFTYNSKENRVEVKQFLVKNYLSDSYQVTIPVAETYNNKVKIDAVTCLIDNRTPKDFKPLDSYYSIDNIFFSDERICYFPVTLPKKGSTATVSFAETITDPRYLTSVYFSDRYKTTIAEITFKIPRWMKVELKEFNFNGSEITKTNVYDSATDSDIITYTAKNLPPVAIEENSPGRSHIYPHILVLSKAATVNGNNFTYLGTVADLYAWYKELIKNAPQDDAIINQKAKELTAGLTADMDKIKAIFYYVQNNIRYIAFEDGIAGFRPEKADEVLRKKYGDCKGMANLTRALLKSIGFDARLCWIGTKHLAYDYGTPSVGVDNHMICGLNYQGKTIFLDATETYIGLNEYAERIQGRQVLMEDGEKYILSNIPGTTSAQNTDTETSKLTINNAALTGSVKRVWTGEEKEVVLAGLNQIKKDKTADAMTKYLSDDDSNYAINELKLSDTNNPDVDLTALYNVANKTSITTFGKSYYIDIDNRKEFLHAAIKTAERKTDFWFSHKANINKETELAIPAGYKISSLPANLDIVNSDYEFHVNYIVDAGKLTYKKKLLIKNANLPVTKFEQWNKDIDQLGKAYTESIILKPSSE